MTLWSYAGGFKVYYLVDGNRIVASAGWAAWKAGEPWPDINWGRANWLSRPVDINDVELVKIRLIGLEQYGSEQGLRT